MRTKKCDVKVWSGTCEHSSSSSLGDKYLCDTCGTITKSDHEVRREGFVHVSGDEDGLS